MCWSSLCVCVEERVQTQTHVSSPEILASTSLGAELAQTQGLSPPPLQTEPLESPVPCFLVLLGVAQVLSVRLDLSLGVESLGREFWSDSDFVFELRPNQVGWREGGSV